MANVQFIHIPKCAGTYIKKVLRFRRDAETGADASCKLYRARYGDCSSLHRPYHEIKKAHTIPIAIVRSPYTRFVSTYYYDIEIWRRLFGERNTQTLDAFLDYLCANPGDMYKHAHLYPQMYFLRDTPNDTRLSRNVHLFSFEGLPMNLKLFLDSMQIPYDGVRIFQTFNDQDAPTYNLTAPQREKVRRLYRTDFEQLGDYFG